MNKIRKPLSFLLAVVMIISMFAAVPFTASAEDGYTVYELALGLPNAVIDLIDAIGTVEYTDACKEKIDAARAAYDALTDAQKALVTNAADLAAAEDAYAALAPVTDTPVYVKVTSEPEDWSGDYLIVYEDGDKAFNGSADELNGSGNFIEVTISEGKIESNDSTDAAKVTIAPFDDGYSIKTASGSYIGGQANQNKLVSLSEPILNTISLDDGNAQIVSNTSTLRFNTGWPGFRYYKTVSQQPIQLYKLTGAAASNPDQEAADEVIALINAIGTVEYTDASKEKIDAARAAYDALTDVQKALVSNDEILTAAEARYAEQKAAAEEAAANQAAADAVIAKINVIGTVEYTDASKAKIDEARAAYDALTDAQKALVSNVDILTTAETAYAALEAAANAHTHDDVTFEAWESTNSLPTAAGNYYLENDVTLSGTWTAPAGVTNLCLNGHTISRTGTGRVISVNSGSTLAIYDCSEDCSESGTGKITGGKMTGYYSYGAGIGVSKGHLLLYGGTITGNHLTSTISGGGGVYVDNSGVVDMYGGAITNNSAAYGGAAYVKGNGAVFNFYGGTISGNKAFDTVGGGMHLWDKAALNMYGGTMSGNTAKTGAAIQASGGSKVSISGGTITGNNATNANGGALSNLRPNGGDQAGTFNISGNPVITGNTAAGQPSDVRLANNVKLTVTGPLTEGAEIGLDPACTASFVDGYSTYNSGDDPNEFFTSDSSATHRIVMDGDQVLLEVIPYDITINPSVNGAVSVLSTSVPNGTTVHLDVVPDTGYVVDTLTVIDGTGSAVAVTVTEDTGTIFVMPASDVTVSATFKVGVYNVSAADCNGTVTADPASAPMGETVTVTAVPDEGHAFRSISAKTKSGKWQRSLTALAGSKTGGEGYDKLVDGKTNTKYGPTSPAAFIIVKADKAFALTDYSLTTANDTAKYSGRNWKSWVIYGANFAADADAVRDSAQWQVVASVTDDTVLGAANYTKYDYTVDASPVMYQYYKVEILDNKASSGMSQMAEFTMTGVIYQDEVELTPDSEDQTKYTLTMPDDDVVILAVFDPVGKVTWQNWDGTVLEIDENVFYGETPEYNGETPAKASDAQNVYTFAGWDAEIEEVSGDKTYTATYDSAINMATVDDVIDKIDAIGDAAYTAESKALIDDAREAYNALTDTQKELVSNYSVLTDAEAAYQLAADKAAFNAYKLDQVAAVQAMAQAGDSAAAQQIIADAASDIAMLAYDETKDLAENKAAVDDLANITEALAAQRTADAKDWMSVRIDDQIYIKYLLHNRANLESVTVEYLDQDGVETVQTQAYTVDQLNFGENDVFEILAVIAPAQIGDLVKVTILANGQQTVYEYSVAKYCEYLIDGAYEENVKTLAKATLEYGRAANDYFYGTADFYHQSTITSPYSAEYKEKALQTAKNLTNTLSVTDNLRTKLASAAFMALTKPEFRFYFNENLTEAKAVELNDNNQITTNVKGVTARFYKNGDGILLEVKGIKAEDMDKVITITVGDLGTIKFSGYDFARMMAKSDDQSIAALGAALYLYGAAAKDCFKPE